jgi:phosphatidate cytidylyltransferase
MLKTRILTAFLLIPLVLVILLFAPIIVFALFSLGLASAAAWEWAGLAGLTKLKERIGYVIVLVLTCIIIWQVPPIWTLTVALLWWLYASYLVVRYPLTKEFWAQNRWLKALMGILTLTFFWIGLLVIRRHSQGVAYFLLVLCIVWAADTGAYFTGRRWGKRPLAPTVSPGKTWEGLAGGLVLSLLVAGIGGVWLDIPLQYWLLGILWVVITIIASVFGDLFESMLKRQANVKDSGKLLPGHGGLLDRIDSLTAAFPLFALGMLLLYRG